MSIEKQFELIAECLMLVAGLVVLMCGAAYLLLSILVGAGEQRQWQNSGKQNGENGENGGCYQPRLVVRVRMAKPPSGGSGVPRV